MVVEPDVLVRMTVADYLRECGYRVVEAITAHSQEQHGKEGSDAR